MAIAAKRASRAKKVEPTISPAAVTQTISRAEITQTQAVAPAPAELIFSVPQAPEPKPAIDAGRWRMAEFAVIGAVLFAIVIWLAPFKLGSMIYITAKIALFSYLAYWIGRRGLHLRISQVTDPILRTQAQIAFSLLFTAAIIVAGVSP